MTLSKLALTAALTVALGAGAPVIVHAQDHNYDGYCYQKRSDAKTSGAVTGAIIGGLVGSQVSKHERGLGTVGGAVVGGAIGANAGKHSVKCYDDEYYSYQGAYYDPPPPPDGYTVTYYKERPDGSYYKHVYYNPNHDMAPPHGY